QAPDRDDVGAAHLQRGGDHLAQRSVVVDHEEASFEILRKEHAARALAGGVPASARLLGGQRARQVDLEARAATRMRVELEAAAEIGDSALDGGEADAHAIALGREIRLEN